MAIDFDMMSVVADGTQDPFGGPQENQVRKELNVPADDTDDDMEKSV